MWNMKFWKAAAERAVKTGAQFAAPVWAATVFTQVGEVVPTGSATILAFVSGAGLSILTSMGSLPFGPADSPSVVGE